MRESPRMRPWHLASSVLVLALALVGLGGVVHTTGSSLACPDWPLCNGQWMPEMTGGVEYEHSHRLLALAVALGVFALPFAIPAGAPRVRRLAFVAVGLVIVQALLGAATVILRLPPPVSIAHLLTASGLVALLGVITLWLRPPLPLRASRGLLQMTDVTLVVLAFQLALGALVRHLRAMYACGDDFLGCAPALAGDGAALLQVAHRGTGYAVLFLAVGLALGAHMDPAASTATRRAAALPALVATAQVALGMAAIAFVVPISLVTLHLVGAELLLLALVSLRVRASSLALSPATTSRRELRASLR